MMKSKLNPAEGLGELAAFKTFLGGIADRYTDAQLLQLSREMHVMADLLLDIYEYGQAAKTQESHPQAHI
jgi:hypothetical protein